jgi:hypothetical protein
VLEKKISMQDAHTSQMYEWLPWVAGNLDSVPKDPAARKAWLARNRGRGPSEAVRKSLAKWYGPQAAASIKAAEAFEICEYGRRPSEDDIRKLFPFFPSK